MADASQPGNGDAPGNLMTVAIGAAMRTPTAAIQFSMSRVCVNKEKAKAMLLDFGAPVRQTLLDNVKDVLKACVIDDPDMCTSLKNMLARMVDLLWEHIQLEIERTIESSLLQQQVSAFVEGPRGTGLLLLWCKFRAFVLHHYLPHNKSIFGKAQDPIYIFILVLSLLPFPGIRPTLFAIILLMLLLPGPPDEHQLLNYFVLFKSVHFGCSGFGLLLQGSFTYLYCYTVHKEDVAMCCDALGPSSVNFGVQMYDYLASALFPWLALTFLPWAQYHSDEYVGRGDHKDKRSRFIFNVAKNEMGGRLSGLMKYDRRCFILSLLLYVFMAFVTDGLNLTSPQGQANLYWTRVFYAFCMIPFPIVKLPTIFVTMTHSTPTGFNEFGACVLWAIPTVRKPKNPWTVKAKELLKGVNKFRKGIKELGRTRRTGSNQKQKPTTAVETAVKPITSAADYATGLFVAATEGLYDEGAEQAPVNLASEPHTLLLVWDRF